ncbi:exopolysaccharide biosynthesis polyprenyl glycosylphosphotransferase [Lichenicola sp.]|uniref:exopolysaccharide biosynthesis polyprenyl glycosylphosphotransferase n=1 Tax=Lichenicola sp. TaxID=2804529 RepID=UPI003AFFCE7D
MIVLWATETLVGVFGFCLVFGSGSAGSLPATAGLGSPALSAVDQAVLLSIMLGLPGIVLGLYKPNVILETRRLLLTAAVAATWSIPLLWLIAGTGMIDTRALFGSSRVWPVELIAFWISLLICTRLAYSFGMRSGILVRDVLVLGDEAAVQAAANAIGMLRPGQFRIRKAGQDAADPPGRSILSSWTVVAPDSLLGADGPALAWTDGGTSARVTDLETFYERQLGRVDLEALARTLSFHGADHGFSEDAVARVLHRGLDIVVAVLLAILTAPLMLVTALLVALDSPGPVIYRQERVGRDGQRFVILKFRSMRTDAEGDGVARFASPRDSRATRFGSFIRKVRLDELPQLYNILRGDMSIVGPRPERPDFVRMYEASIPLYRMRLQVKPGLTGWAQVNSAYTASVAETREKLAYDLYYLRNRSILLDLTILLATVRVILFGVGAR